MPLTLAEEAYLEAVEHQPFAPTGWLYDSIYAELATRSLVVRDQAGCGYRITELGRAALQEARQTRTPV